MECGATSISAQGTAENNQCIYLALAAGVAAPNENHHHVAIELRQQIEGAVRAARPYWAAHDFIAQEVRSIGSSPIEQQPPTARRTSWHDPAVCIHGDVVSSYPALKLQMLLFRDSS